ncbi:MAG TPA: thioredoxin domain-containing protein [Xanthomonadales bacterium]|nr:thioredoxin domain-containing protein [Xanthomonadales bacterium]
MMLSTMSSRASVLSLAVVAAALLVPAAAARAGGVWTAVGDPHVGGTVSPALRGKPLVVRVHADWCGECQTSLPDFERFIKAYRGKVNVVDVDVTDGKTSAVAAARTQRLGLGAYYERTKAQPLTVAFIDPNTGTVHAALRGNVDLNDLIAAEKSVERSLRGR